MCFCPSKKSPEVALIPKGGLYRIHDLSVTNGHCSIITSKRYSFTCLQMPSAMDARMGINIVIRPVSYQTPRSRPKSPQVYVEAGSLRHGQLEIFNIQLCVVEREEVALK
jgi:hypothetical protein